jgi:septum formation protein
MRDILVLASASPRRRELLARVGVRLEVAPADVDEMPRPGEAPAAYARRVAADKLAAAAARHAGRWLLAADTVVEVDGAILGKAADAAEARAMLDRLNGRRHRVATAFSIAGPDGKRADELVVSDVVMRRAAATELDDYVRSDEWRGKAGAYAVQGIAAALVREVHGSITNVVGLPLAEVLEALARLGGPAPRYAEGEPA